MAPYFFSDITKGLSKNRGKVFIFQTQKFLVGKNPKFRFGKTTNPSAIFDAGVCWAATTWRLPSPG
jgi:hypothetical protein